MSSPPISLNAARKRRAGLADTGRCPECGRYRVTCRAGCLDTAWEKIAEPELAALLIKYEVRARVEAILARERRNVPHR